MLDLISLDGAALRNDVFEERPEPRNVPLPVAKSEDQLAFRLAWCHCESPVERATGGNHAQVPVEHEKRLPYGVDDSLGQVMPTRDVSERIVFGGHAGNSALSASSARGVLANLAGRTEPRRIPEKETAPGNTRGRFITRRYTTRRLTLIVSYASSAWRLSRRFFIPPKQRHENAIGDGESGNC